MAGTSMHLTWGGDTSGGADTLWGADTSWGACLPAAVHPGRQWEQLRWLVSYYPTDSKLEFWTPEFSPGCWGHLGAKQQLGGCHHCLLPSFPPSCPSLPFK